MLRPDILRAFFLSDLTQADWNVASASNFTWKGMAEAYGMRFNAEAQPPMAESHARQMKIDKWKTSKSAVLSAVCEMLMRRKKRSDG